MRVVNIHFSNRPFGVKRFQTIYHCSVDVARGLVLLSSMRGFWLRNVFTCTGR